jgi:putative ABC transport system permease protein
MIGTLTRRSLRARLGRNFAVMAAILAGVAFVAGAFVVADSLKGTFNNLVDGLAGEIDLEVRSELTVDNLDAIRDPLPIELVDVVAAVPGVGQIEPGVGRSALLIDPNGDPVVTQGAPTLGVSWNGDDSIGGVELKTGRAPVGMNEMAVDKATADRVGYELGDTVTVVTPTGPMQFELVGTIGLGNSDGFAGATTSVFDFETAAVVLDTNGTVDTIDMLVEDGADIEEVRAAIREVLPPRTEVVTGEEVADEIKDQVGVVIGYFQLGLLIFAFVTAFVAAFVINNVFGITIGQRLRELALLRAVGASGPQVRRLVIAEALIIATIATVLGILGGYVVGWGIIWAFNAAGGGFPPTPLIMQTRTILVAAFVGIGIALASVLIPAVRASRIPPVAAMHPELGFGALSASQRLVRAGLTTGIGVAAFLFGLFASPGGSFMLIVFIGGGALLTFLGVASLSTAVARPVTHGIGTPFAKLFGVPGRFARDNASRAPRRTARTASALMIGVALIAAASVFAASLRDTVGRLLDNAIKADYIVYDPSSFQPLPPEVAARMEALPELSDVSPFRSIRGDVGPDDTVSLTAVNPDSFPELVNVDVTAGSFDALNGTGVMVYDEAAEDRGLSIGDPVDVLWQNGVESTLTVAGLFSDNSLDASWFISIDTLESVSTQTPNDQFVLAKVAEGLTVAEVTPIVDAAISDFPQAQTQTDSEFQEEQEAQINQILALITILLLVAIAFSFLGIAITLALSVYERTREIGLLRAVGMTRRQLLGAVDLEAIIVTLFGVAIGLVLGTLFGIALSSAVPESVINGITISWGTMITVVVFAVIAAAIAALYPAIKASRMDVLDAIATE